MKKLVSVSLILLAVVLGCLSLFFLMGCISFTLSKDETTANGLALIFCGAFSLFFGANACGLVEYVWGRRGRKGREEL